MLIIRCQQRQGRGEANLKQARQEQTWLPRSTLKPQMDRCDANLISWGSREDSWNAGSEPLLPRRLLKPFCPLPSAFPPCLTPDVQFWRCFQNRDRTPNKIIEPLTKVETLCSSEKRISNEALLREHTQKLKLCNFSLHCDRY